MSVLSQEKQFGFTLVELMITLVVVAILAAIALPGFQNFIKKSRAKTASADLVSLSASVENVFQRTLAYPKENNTTQFTTWRPSQETFFTFSYTAPDHDGIYTLRANGIGSLTGCELVFKSNNTRNVSGDCGGMTSW